jgi:RNA polymerase sigma-70 factor (family 1)
MSPRELLAQLRNGDHQAFSTLFDAYVDRVYRFMRRHTRSHTEAQDLTQVLFIKLWEKRATIDPDRPFDAYLFVVAHNLVVDHLRQLARRPSLESLPDESLQSPTVTPRPDEHLHYRQLEHLYHHAIDALPPRRRDVFRLSRLEGLSHQQIASRLGISVRTVENHLAAAMQSIRDFFARQDMGPASMLLFFFWLD